MAKTGSKRKRDELVFRSARVEDVPGIHKLINRFARQGKMLGRSLPELYEMVRDFVVCIKNRRIIGCGAIRVYWEDLAEIKSLAVDARNQGKNIGGRIVTMLEEEAARCGVEKTFVLTFAPGFFGKLGYAETEKENFPHKIWADCVKCPHFPDCKEVAMIKTVRGDNTP